MGWMDGWRGIRARYYGFDVGKLDYHSSVLAHYRGFDRELDTISLSSPDLRL